MPQRFGHRWAAVSAGIGSFAGAVLLGGALDLPRERREASALAVHTLEAMGAISTLESHLAQAVAEGRNFVISPEPAIRERTDAAAAKVLGDLAGLWALIADSPVQRENVDRLKSLIDERLAVLRASMNLKASRDEVSLQRSIEVHPGVILSDRIGRLIGDIQAQETRLLALRQREADAATRATMIAIVAAGLIAAASALFVAVAAIERQRERKRARELRRMDALLATILQSAPGHIYAKDMQGRMLVANAAVLAFHGMEWGDLEGLTEREFLDDPAEAEAIIANDRIVIASGRTQVLEERIGLEGEPPRVWLSIKTPMRDADGAIVGMVGISMDITERKRDEERLQSFNAALEASVAARTAALADSEARQRAYFSHSPIGMIVMRVAANGDFVLEDSNPAARAAFGFRPEDPRGLTQSELWPELVDRDKQKKIQACASRREIIDYSVTRTIDGEQRELDIVLAPLLDDAIEARFVLMCVQDVTRQRALERQVVEQAERQAEAAECEMALFRNSADELFIVRVRDENGVPDFIYEAFSPALEAMTGLQADDLVGRRPHECLPAVVADPILDNYRCCFHQQQTIKFAETRALPIGQRDVEGWVTPVRHPTTGRIVRLVGSVRDVTERNRMEAALRQAQKMEAIGVLAAGVAHDFNNILQAVTSGLDLVMDEVQDGSPAHEFASIALGSAMRGSQLTHHLLSYARKQMLLPQTIDVASFLDDVKTLLSRTLGPHIAIVLHADRGLRMRADPIELETALLNLAINAAHAMPKGGTLTLEALAERIGEQTWATVTVSDTGSGMDPATLARAAEPFFTTKGVNGTGLGLSMVQGFAEQSGGTLRIASTPGLGTTVMLRLPAAAAEAPPPHGARPAPPEPGRAAGRVLLVDDSPDVLVTVGAFLERAGYEVARAGSGDGALAILATGGRFDALVTDYAMPGLDGAALLDQARLMQPHLHALIITGYAAVSGAAIQEGITVLHKPFHRGDLVEALQRIMAGDARLDA